MLTGKRFRLGRATLALEINDGTRKAVTVPIDSIIKVVSGPKNGDGLVDILWDERPLAMFEVDVNVRGTEITDQSAGA
jgi:hypothetical protein